MLSIILFQGLAVAGDLGQFGKDIRADGIRQDGVAERGGSLLGGRVGLGPLQEINDLLGLGAVLHGGGVQDDVGVTADRPGAIALAIHDDGQSVYR